MQGEGSGRQKKLLQLAPSVESREFVLKRSNAASKPPDPPDHPPKTASGKTEQGSSAKRPRLVLHTTDSQPANVRVDPCNKYRITSDDVNCDVPDYALIDDEDVEADDEDESYKERKQEEYQRQTALIGLLNWLKINFASWTCTFDDRNATEYVDWKSMLIQWKSSHIRHSVTYQYDPNYKEDGTKTDVTVRIAMTKGQTAKGDALEMLKRVCMDPTVTIGEVQHFVKCVEKGQSLKTHFERLFSKIHVVASFTTAHEDDKSKIKEEEDDGSDGDFDDDDSDADWRKPDRSDDMDEDDLDGRFRQENKYWNGLSELQQLQSMLDSGYACELIDGELKRSKDTIPGEGLPAAYKRYEALLHSLKIASRDEVNSVKVTEKHARSVFEEGREKIKFPLTFIVPIDDPAAAGAASKESVDDGERQAFWSVDKSEEDCTMLIAERIKCDTEVTDKFLQTVLTDKMEDDRRVMSRNVGPPARFTEGWDGNPYSSDTLQGHRTGNLTLGQKVEMVNKVTGDFEHLPGACDKTFTVKHVQYEAEEFNVVLRMYDIMDNEFAKWLNFLEQAKTKQGGLKTITEYIGSKKKKKASKEDTRDAKDDGDDSGGEDDEQRLEKGTRTEQQTWSTFDLFSGKKLMGTVKYQKKDGWTNINAVLTIKNRYVTTTEDGNEDELLFFHFSEIGDDASSEPPSSEGGRRSGSSSGGSSGDDSDQSYISVAGSASDSE